MPTKMLFAKGIKINVKNAGTASSISSKSINLIKFIIKIPANIRVVAVAAEGTNETKEDKNEDIKNKTHVIMEVSPVLPLQ